MSIHKHEETTSLARDLFLLALIALLGLGTMMIFSATGFSRSLQLQPGFILRHVIFLGISGGLFWGILRTPTAVLERWIPWLFLGLLILLVVVLIPGVGLKVNGARRWFRAGPISLQPSEFMKILLPMWLAWWSRQTWGRWGVRKILLGMAVLIVTPLLIALQPDLGTALMVFGVGACFLFLAGWPLSMFATGALGLIPLLGWLMVSRPYQWQRILDYLQAFGNWEQAHYQIKQSLLSIGSGGLWGTGLGRGLQKLSFLPESHTDFVFAVIGEELGLVGLLGVIALWCLLLGSGVRLIAQARLDRENFALAGTLLLGIVLQALINTCVVTSLLPPKGISHPLISYGGSNLLAVLLGLAVVLNLTQKTREGA